MCNLLVIHLTRKLVCYALVSFQARSVAFLLIIFKLKNCVGLTITPPTNTHFQMYAEICTYYFFFFDVNFFINAQISSMLLFSYSSFYMMDYDLFIGLICGEAVEVSISLLSLNHLFGKLVKNQYRWIRTGISYMNMLFKNYFWSVSLKQDWLETYNNSAFILMISTYLKQSIFYYLEY